jgi:hypothetical protein
VPLFYLLVPVRVYYLREIARIPRDLAWFIALR